MSPDSPPIEAEGPDKHQLDRAPQSSTSTTLERSSLESLPDEVLTDIIRNGDSENTSCMTLSLCLVSKRIEPVARQELYRAISILTYRSLTSLCRTLQEKPELGQHMRELKLLVPWDEIRPDKPPRGPTEADFELLWSLYLQLLKRSAGLRKLTTMPVAYGRNRGPTLSPYYDHIHKHSDSIIRPQHSGSTTAILPRLEQVRLISDINSPCWWNCAIVHPEVFKPFLHLSSLSSLECINDSGIWGSCSPSVQPTGSPQNELLNVHHHEQIKSVVLQESDCNPTDIMDLVNVFPSLDLFFIQKRVSTGWDSHERAEEAITKQRRANQLEKRYLSDSLEKLQKLNTVAFIPHGNKSCLPDYTRDFLGYSRFLSLKKLCNLTSISVLIDVFASPGGSPNGHLTVSPSEVLPRSLRYLHIIVDHRIGDRFQPRTRLNQAWFQPRAAALGFMEELSSICSNEFPGLQQVEYIWAVTRLTEIQHSQMYHGLRSQAGPVILTFHPLGSNYEYNLANEQPCDGSVPLCCPMHTTIQALSPDMDYTSKAAGIVSPFRDRFDSLEFAFKNVGVGFQIIELKEYSDFFFHWQNGRK